VDRNRCTTNISRNALHIRQYVNGSRSRSLRLAHADPDSYTHADPDSYAHAHPDSYAHAHPDSYTNAHPDSHSNPDTDTSAEHRRSDQLKLVGLRGGKQSFQPAVRFGDRGLRVVDRSDGHGIITRHN
jgi:hypothetical protein